MPSSDDLIQHVYDYFLKAYHQGASSASGGALVAFEPIGFSPGCVSVPGPGVVNAALQEVSQLADVLPQVDGGVYTHTGRTISAQYANIINVAQPTSATSVASFSGFKSQAGKLYNDATSDGELDGPKATFTTPVDWYDLHNAANWSNYSYDTSVQQASPAPATPPAPAVHLTWRVVDPDLRSEVFQRPVQARVMAAEPVSGPSIGTVGERAMFSRAPMVAEPMAIHSQAQLATATQRVEPVTQLQATNFASRASVVQLVAKTAPQPVETASFKLTFDYCVVHLRRPWLSGDFLATPGWYVPGAHGGDYSSGAAANKGWFAVLPTAFIAVRNLLINGSWSANDVVAAGNSAAFGPFSLLGISASQSGVLSNPGVQIIAWVCDPQPKLPPDNDPSAAPTAT